MNSETASTLPARAGPLDLLPAPRRGRGSDGLALAATVVGAALAAWMALLSDGVHHDDDLVHFQMAAWSFEYPAYLLNTWGRPGFTVLYALPAQFGMPAARLFSVLLTAITGWLAYRIAVRQGIALAWLAPVLLWLQPMTFTLSYTTLTEPVLALYLTIAMWLLLRRHFTACAVVASLCMVTRHEGAIFVGFFACALWRERRPLREWAWLAWAPLVQNILSRFVLGTLPLLTFLDTTPTHEYGTGGWLAMIARWPIAAGVGAIALACAGAPFVTRRPGGKLWIGCGVAFLLAHTLIYRFGLFASGGYYRFLVPLGPIIAVSAAAALSEYYRAFVLEGRAGNARANHATIRQLNLTVVAALLVLWLAVELEIPDWLGWLLPWLRYGAVALLAGCVLTTFAIRAQHPRAVRRLAAVYPAALVWIVLWQPSFGRGIEPPFQQCAPLILVDDQILIREAVDWLRENGLAQRRLVTANAWPRHFLNRSASPFGVPPAQEVNTMQPGDLLLWDARYCPSPAHNIHLADLRRRSDFVQLWHGREHPNGRDGVYCYVFEKRALPATRPADQR